MFWSVLECLQGPLGQVFDASTIGDVTGHCVNSMKPFSYGILETTGSDTAIYGARTEASDWALGLRNVATVLLDGCPGHF